MAMSVKTSNRRQSPLLTTYQRQSILIQTEAPKEHDEAYLINLKATRNERKHAQSYRVYEDGANN